MMSITRAGALFSIVLLVLGPTVGIEIAKGAAGASDPSDGWQIPEGAATEPTPEPVTAASVTRGQSLYKAKCQRCHGLDGTGHGPDSDPDHPAADLTDGRRASRNPDGVIFYKIWNGRAKPKMPAMKVDVDRADVWKLVHYVKTLRRQQPAGD
jgi:mono/diheme cytochrome c family protein